MRVDEAGRDDRAAEIFGVARRLAAVHVGDQPVLDPQPAALVLGARVVHGHEPRIAVRGHDTSSGTSSNRSTSTSP